MGGIVTKNNINELAENINSYRKTTGGTFSEKVTALNELTKSLLIK